MDVVEECLGFDPAQATDVAAGDMAAGEQLVHLGSANPEAVGGLVDGEQDAFGVATVRSICRPRLRVGVRPWHGASGSELVLLRIALELVPGGLLGDGGPRLEAANTPAVFTAVAELADGRYLKPDWADM